MHTRTRTRTPSRLPLTHTALEGTPAPAAAPAAAAAAAPEATPAVAAVAAPPPPPAPHHAAALPGRVPSIRFPPRRTLGGEVISTLSAAAQAAALAAVAGSGGGGGAHASTPAPLPSTLPPLSQRISGLYASSSDTKWYAGKERGVKLTASRLLSDKEMELIELGGAV